MSSRTPGFIFLAQSAFVLSTLLLIVYGLSNYFISSSGSFWTSPAFLTSVTLPVAFVAQVWYKLLYQRWRAASLGARLVSTPGGWPGNFEFLKKLLKWSSTGYPGDGLKDILDARGNIFDMRVMFEDVIITTEPHHIKTILSSDFNNYVKGDCFKHACRSVLGNGVFNADGDMWKFHRSMTRPFFVRDRISDFQLFDRHAEEIIGLMKNRLKEGYSIDFQDAVARFTLDSATEFLFGTSVHSMSTGLPYPHHAPSHLLPTSKSYTAQDVHNPTADIFAAAFLDSQCHVSKRLRIGWLWPIAEIFKENTKVPMKIVNAYIDPIVKEAVKKNQNAVSGKMDVEKQELEEDVTLLDHLSRYTKDEKVLKDETTNILIAGRDTTATTLTFMFFFLATHPYVTRKLRAEVMEHVGPSTMPSYDHIKGMKYLRAVINETLRLYPAVPFNTRSSINEAVWPSGTPGEKPYYIPAKTRIAYSVFLMHRRKDLWGPDAEEFDPDRFIDERLKKYIIPNNFIFLPFNAGPRICLGQQFAYNEISFITVRLLQQFSSFALDRSSQTPGTIPPDSWKEEVGTRKGKDGLWPKAHLTMYNEGGLWMRLQEVDDKVEI